MSTWLKTAGVAAPIVLAVLWAAYHFGQITERDRIASLPADTVIVINVDTARVVETLERIDTIRVHSVDTVYFSGQELYRARGDTIIEGIGISAEFIQSLPISMDGFFRFKVDIPDSLRTVEEKIVYITKTVTTSELPWHWAVICVLLGFLGGVAL